MGMDLPQPQEREAVADYRGPYLFRTSDSYQWRERIAKEEATGTRLKKMLASTQQRRIDAAAASARSQLSIPKPSTTFSLASAQFASAREREAAARGFILMKPTQPWPLQSDKTWLVMRHHAHAPSPPNRATPWRS